MGRAARRLLQKSQREKTVACTMFMVMGTWAMVELGYFGDALTLLTRGMAGRTNASNQE